MSLYQTYRPSQWSQIEGQEPIIQTITNQIIHNTLSHAYILFGPRGVGKTTTARLLAKAINCTNRKPNDAEPCETCASCQAIKDNATPDIIEIDAASHTKVEEVRETILASLLYPPTQLKYKIFIIDEVHMMSNSSFNALLKSLEEPPERVLFILATTDLYKVPTTVVSRCQRYGFRKVSKELMIKRMKEVLEAEKRTADAEVLERIAKKSDGALRDALTLLDQVSTVSLAHITIEDLQHVIPDVSEETLYAFLHAIGSGNGTDIVATSNTVLSTGTSISRALDQLLDILARAIEIRYKVDPKLINISAEEMTKITEATTALSLEQLSALMDAVILRKSQLKHIPYGELALELIAFGVQPQSSTVTPVPPSTIGQTTAPQQQTKPLLPQTPAMTTIITPAQIMPAPSIPEKKEIEKTTPPILQTQSENTKNIPHASWKESWQNIIQQAETASASLALILRNVTLLESPDGSTILSVPFALHAEKLENAGSKKNFQNTLLAIFGTLPIYHVKVIPPLSSPAEDPALTAFANALGGNVAA